MSMGPTEQEIRGRFAALIAGGCSREEADRWAGQWVYAAVPPEMPAHLWKALTLLAGCDLTHGRPGGYLHSTEQFQEWLEDFNRACEPA
jgi:hypothetical protein